MTAIEHIEYTGTEAVKKLRLNKLKNGHFFMINSKELGFNQCYLEYPDGSIFVAFLNSSDRNFSIIRVLSPDEEQQIRNRFGFARL